MSDHHHHHQPNTAEAATVAALVYAIQCNGFIQKSAAELHLFCMFASLSLTIVDVSVMEPHYYGD